MSGKNTVIVNSVVEKATDAETVAGAETDRVITPANLTARLAAPGALGGITPAAGTFTTLTFTSGLIPSANDGAALGSASRRVSDVFMASGAVMDWNSDVTLTHSSDLLTLAGGRLLISQNGAASAPPLHLNGSVFTGGTSVTTKPLLFLEPAGTSSGFWQTSGTLLGINAPSGFGGYLIDAQHNGSTRFYLDSNGTLNAAGGLSHANSNAALTLQQYNFISATAVVNVGTGSMSHSAGVVSIVRVPSTINQSGTGGYKVFHADVTHTATGSGVRHLFSGAVGGSTVFSVDSTGVTTVCANTSTPASGSAFARLLFGTTAGFGIYYGSGAPAVSAAQGSLYLRSDGSATNDRIYVNNSAGSGTTWTALTSAA